MARQRGRVYQLERVPPDLLRRAKARAVLEGKTVRGILLARLEDYAAGSVTPNPQEVREAIGSPAAGTPSQRQPDAHRPRGVKADDEPF